MNESCPRLIAVMGTTASGKTVLAEALADRFDAQLINADAFQVYRGMDIGTAKPVQKERYSLLDLKDPDEGFGVGEWVLAARDVLTRLWSENRSAVIVGGTGLYVRALLQRYGALQPSPDPELRRRLEKQEAEQGLESLLSDLAKLDPEAAATVDPKNPVRVRRALERALTPSAPLSLDLPPFRVTKLAVQVPREVLNEKIAQRANDMVQNGWVQEVNDLRDNGFRPENPGFRALGYRQLFDYLDGKVGLQEAMATTIAATRQYAKRQRTWLRSEPELAMLPEEPEPEIFERALSAIGASIV